MRRRLGQIVEDARRADDVGLLRVRERHLDDFDPEQRRGRVRVGLADRTAGQLVRRAHRRRAGHIDVDVVGIGRRRHDGVRVRAPARLHVGDANRITEIGPIEDADPAQPVMTDGVGDALGAAVGAAVQRFARHEQEVAIHGHVALRSRTDERLVQFRDFDVRDVPDLHTVEVALNDVVTAERHVGVDEAEIAGRVAIDELGRRRRRRDESHVPVRCPGIEPPRAQPDPWILAGCGRRVGLRRGASPYADRNSE